MLKKDLRALDRVFIHTVMFNVGIIPMEDPGHDVSRVLAQLSPEDARKARRKFRKLWRKEIKSEQKKSHSRDAAWIKKQVGQGSVKPSRSQKILRKSIVYRKLWIDIIQPLVQLAECPVKEKNVG